MKQGCQLLTRIKGIKGNSKKLNSIISAFKSVVLTPGTYIDRIGPFMGRFVAVVQRDPRNNKAIPASYSSRSLRTLGETPYDYPEGSTTIDLRRVLYEMIYTHDNDPDNTLYYVLKVVKPITGMNPCKAAPAFDYPGGALQLGLPKSVDDLLADGSLKKLSTNETEALFGYHFPPYESDIDGNDAAFRPHNSNLNKIMDTYYSTEAEGETWRAANITVPSPTGTETPAALRVALNTNLMSPPPKSVASSFSPAGIATALDFTSPPPKNTAASTTS